MYLTLKITPFSEKIKLFYSEKIQEKSAASNLIPETADDVFFYLLLRKIFPLTNSLSR
jgi:hypothetical protein